MSGSKDYTPTVAEMEEAFRQVGRFMFNWAYLEGELNTAVEKLLRLGVLEGAIATANIQARDKIHIVKTAIRHRARRRSERWTTASVRVINRIANLSDDRNTVAHNFFGPNGGGAIRFYKVRAKGGARPRRGSLERGGLRPSE